MLKRICNATFVIIGTFIGAGFASGQEIYIFFYKYGVKGIIGILISSLILGLVIYKTFIICKNNKINNYKDFLKRFIDNQKILDVFNTIINIFILITFYIMIAGFGAYFEQQFNINSIIGSSILALICYYIFLKNVSGLIKTNQIIVPILVISILVIGMNAIKLNDISQISNYLSNNSSFKWVLDSVLYGSYNTILLIPVLITLSRFVKNKRENTIICILTMIAIILLSLIIFFMLLRVDVNIENLEMPSVYVASKVSVVFKYLYGFIILSSILTTSISLGTSFLENISKTDKSRNKYAMLICITSIAVSKIGFSNLVNLLYPIFGYIGLIQIIKILLFFG